MDTSAVDNRVKAIYEDFKDSITPGGKFLKFYMNQKGEAVVAWGHLKKSKNFGEPFGSYNPPWYYCEWRNFIGLRSGCGTDCKILTVLPLKGNQEIKSYADIAIDTANNLIFYSENPAQNLYYVINIETGFKTKIPVSIQKPEMNGVDSAAFIGKDKLYLKWRDENYGVDNVAERENVFILDNGLALPYIQYNICPFEACRYGGNWQVNKATPVYDDEDEKNYVFTLNKGDTFIALKGNVHITKPGVLQVKQNYYGFKNGERIKVMTYRGEEFYDIWYNGKIFDAEDIEEFWTENVSGNRKGVLLSEPETKWWIYIQTKEGKKGWIRGDGNIER